MNNLSITTCSFHLKKFNTKKTSNIYYLNQSITYNDEKGLEKNIAVRDLFLSFASRYNYSEKDDDKQKTFSCEYLSSYGVVNDSFECLSFKIESGYYGSSSSIVDSDTREKKYEMKPTDVAEKTFYMFIIIPRDNNTVRVNKGLIIFQNVGAFGVKTITTQKINDYFTDYYNISLKCATVTPALFVKKVLSKENIKQMILVKNYKSKDDMDDYYLGYGTERRIIGRLSFSDNVWANIINNISQFINGESKLFEFQHGEYDNVKLDVEINGRRRTINLHNIEKCSVIESIPNEIKNGKGYADFSKLLQHIEGVALDYISEMTLEIK